MSDLHAAERTRLDSVAVGFGAFFLLIAAAVLVDRAGWIDVSFATVLAVALLVAGGVLVIGSMTSRRSKI
jgi:hypothetical protein